MTTSKTFDNKFELTKRPGQLNLLVVGDVHLGNKLTRATETIAGLLKMLPNNKETAELDMIIIEGDLFDEGLMYNSEYLSNIQSWMCLLIRKCLKYDIALRVLEGTPSHDNKQSRNFQTLIDAMEIDIDYRYMDDMVIEEHPKFGTILYVPDEWSTSKEHTLDAARKLISTYGIKQVDYAVMHCAFRYQLPPIAADTTHDPEPWMGLVKYCIFVGHIHQHSIYNKTIIAAGSFDRHTHGDEKPKGHVRAMLSKDGVDVKFIKNDLAKRFDTVDCRGLSVEDTLSKLEEHIKLPKGSHIRLLALTTDNTSTAAKYLAAEYPDFHWKIEVSDASKDVDVQKIAMLPQVRLESRSISASNIQSVVLDYAQRKYTGDMALTQEQLDGLKKTLGAICKEV